jgi:phosphotransacetylase
LEIPTYHKLLIATDAAITIEPSAEDKLQLVQNAVDICRGLGVDKPKVAMLAAVEKVNPKMTSTVHAAEVARLAKEGRVKNAIVEGPYDMYIATSAEGAAIKGIKGEVAGDADIIVFPEINSANCFYKTVSQFVPGIRIAGVIAGAKIPIVLPSRADAAEIKRLSLIVAAYLKRAENI